MKLVVFEDKTDVVSLKNCSEDRIYILMLIDENSKCFYKLQCLPSGKDYAWFQLDNSQYNWNGTHDSFKDALKSMKKANIYEFSSLADFAQWLAKEVSQ